jgi:hypothetical protein
MNTKFLSRNVKEIVNVKVLGADENSKPDLKRSRLEGSRLDISDSGQAPDVVNIGCCGHVMWTRDVNMLRCEHVM